MFCPIFFKLGQDVYLDEIWAKFEFGSGRVKKQVSRSNLRKTLFMLQGPHFFTHSSLNLVKIFILIISQTSLNIGQVGSKSRSVGQILEKLCLWSRGHIFGPIFLKLGQNVCLDDTLTPFDFKWGPVEKQVTRSNLSFKSVILCNVCKHYYLRLK